MAGSERNLKAMQLLSSFVRQDSDEKEDTETQDGKINGHGKQISRPRHRQAFLYRAHTYTPLRWFAKPSWLSPLECSRYGWENVEVDVLQCVSCKAHISGRMPASHNPKAYDECCQRVSKSLKEGHSPSCPWSSSPSPEYFLRLPHDTRPKADRVFRQHFELLIQLGEQLPLLDDTALDKMGLVDVQLQQIVHNYTGLCTDVSPEVARSAAILSLTGWASSSSNASTAMVHCSLCNRHVGMWNFLTLAKPSVETVVTDVAESPVASRPNGHAITDGSDQELPGQHLSEGSVQDGESGTETNGVSIEAQTTETMDVDDKEMSETIDTKAQETKSDESEVPKTEDIQSEIPKTELATVGNTEDTKSETKDSQSKLEPETVLSESKPEIESRQLEISEKIDSKSEIVDIKPTESEVASPVKPETDAAQAEASSPVAKKSDPEQNLTRTPFPDSEANKSEDSLFLANDSKVPVSQTDKSDNAAPQTSAASVEESGSPSQSESPVSTEQNSEKVEDMETGDNVGDDVGKSEASESMTAEEAVPETEKRESEVDTDTEPSAKRQKTTEEIVPVRRKHTRQTTVFGPLSEHHTWCPWVTAGGSSSGQQAGWRQVLYLLVPELSPDKSSSIPRGPHKPSPDVLRSIRRLFNEWTAPATTR